MATAKKTTAPVDRAAAGDASEAPAKAAAPAETATAGKAPAKTPARSARAAATTPVKTAAKAAERARPKAGAAQAPAKDAGTAPAGAAGTSAAGTTAAGASSAAGVSSGVGAAPAAPQDGWTAAELDEVRSELDAQAEALRAEIDRAEAASESLKRDQSSEGSGDEADAGSKTFEREHEMSLANNSRDLLVQVGRALGRLDAGTYGRCEECGNPIPKPRLQAFPRATLCVACKQREERR